jgi:ABC-type ATPase with predicted acetyltransferase domain
LDRKQLDLLLPEPGQVALINGPSGAGKSRLLRAIQNRIGAGRCIDLNKLNLPRCPLVDAFAGRSTEQVLALLNRVGLSEAWTYVRKPTELSDGQRWRFRLAMALYRAHRQCQFTGTVRQRNSATKVALPVTFLVCDEFAALLDRVTASVVAHTLRRTISASPNLAAIVVTSHDDLGKPLAPDLHVHCDFGQAILTRFSATDARSRSKPAPRKSPR